MQFLNSNFNQLTLKTNKQKYQKIFIYFNIFFLFSSIMKNQNKLPSLNIQEVEQSNQELISTSSRKQTTVKKSNKKHQGLIEEIYQNQNNLQTPVSKFKHYDKSQNVSSRTSSIQNLATNTHKMQQHYIIDNSINSDSDLEDPYNSQRKRNLNQFTNLRKKQQQNTNNEIPEELNNYSVDELFDRYQKQKIKLSNLTKQQYMQVCNQGENQENIDELHYLPDIKKRKQLPFISKSCIKKLNHNLVKTINESLNQVNTTKNIDLQLDSLYNINSQQGINLTSRNYDKNDVKKLFSAKSDRKKYISQNYSILDQSNYTDRSKITSAFKDNTIDITDRIINNSINTQLLHNKNSKKQFLETDKQLQKYEWKQLFNKQKIQQDKINKVQRLIKQYPSNNMPTLMIGQDSSTSIKQSALKKKQLNQISETSLQIIKSQNNLGSAQSLEKINSPKKQQKKFNVNFQFNSVDSVFYSYAKNIDQNFWRPFSRENFTITICNKIPYMYGGIGIRPATETNCFNSFNNNNFKWQTEVMKGDTPYIGRYGHSLNSYQDQFLILFGGCEDRNLTNDLRIFNTQTKKFQWVRSQGELVDPRRNHASFIIGRYLMIHGGISQKGHHFNDLWSFDIVGQRWTQIKILNPKKQQEEANKMLQFNKQNIKSQEKSDEEKKQQLIYENGVAHHKAVAVFHPERKNVNLYRSLEHNDKFAAQIQHEGVYFFGGVDQKQQVYEGIHILKLDKKNFVQWQTLYPQGQPPKNRFSHTMEFCASLGIVIIHGGSTEQGDFLNDIFILKLANLEWVQTKNYISPGLDNSQFSRSGHCSFTLGTQFYIYGGHNQYGYVTCQTQVFELNQQTALRYIKSDEIQKKEDQTKQEFIDKVNQSIQLKKSQEKQTQIQIINSILEKEEQLDLQQRVIQQFKKNVNQQKQLLSSQDSNDSQIMEKNKKNINLINPKLNFDNFYTYQPMDRRDSNKIIDLSLIQQQNLKYLNKKRPSTQKVSFKIENDDKNDNQNLSNQEL